MDSKLKRTALLTSFFTVAGLLVLVGILNHGSGKKPSAGNLSPDASGAAVPEPPEKGKTGGQIGNDLHGFLQDETFFDPEENEYMQKLLDESGRLKLSVYSAEKDLRIRVTDREGKTVTGENFVVTVEGVGEYRDLERDGLIYIADLEPGEYQLYLNPVKDYKVPEGTLKVIVREQLQYLPIDDIAYLVKKEEEIDRKAEDIERTAVLKDADRTQVTGVRKTDGKMKIGVDVSSLTGEVDWEKVHEAGADYAMIRAGYRGADTGSLIVDENFEKNLKEALLTGMDVGVVFCSGATDEKEAVEEASAVLDLVDGHHITYPVVINMQGMEENTGTSGLSGKKRTEIAKAFCRTVENAGYQAGVYASERQLEKSLGTEELQNYCIWLAEYREVPEYEGYYQMWQYTAGGKIDGIRGKAHLDISYLNLE